jgi:putative FmdB family regulatory protein
MPIYEYRCNQCQKEFNQLFLNQREVKKVKCKHCGGHDLEKLISSFSVHQTEASRMSNFDTSKPRGNDFYKDSRNVGLWAKKRMKEMGVDLGPKMDEIVERGRSGKILEDYDK